LSASINTASRSVGVFFAIASFARDQCPVLPIKPGSVAGWVNARRDIPPPIFGLVPGTEPETCRDLSLEQRRG